MDKKQRRYTTLVNRL